jgi:hypothetical protein
MLCKEALIILNRSFGSYSKKLVHLNHCVVIRCCLAIQDLKNPVGTVIARKIS